MPKGYVDTMNHVEKLNEFNQQTFSRRQFHTIDYSRFLKFPSHLGGHPKIENNNEWKSPRLARLIELHTVGFLTEDPVYVYVRACNSH